MSTDYSDLAQQYSSKPDGYYDHPRQEMIQFVPNGSRRVLDVGCSTGAFGAGLKQAMPECVVWGIEPDKQSAAKAAKRLDYVINGTFSADLPELKNERFDAICFNDVLEHLPDPERVLVGCKALLSPQGVVVASIPNILYFPVITRILIFQDWEYQESGTLDKTHLRFFTKKSIARLFKETGYRADMIVGIKPSATKIFRLTNLLLLNRISDWRYLQFAVTAIPISKV